MKLRPNPDSTKKIIKDTTGRLSTFFENFREFALRGNVIDMVVGVILGGAFNKIVSSLVKDIFMPFMGLILGGVHLNKYTLTLRDPIMNKTGAVVSEAVKLNIGSFLQVTIDFIIIAFSLYLVVQSMARMRFLFDKKKETTEKEILTQIRDLLKQQQEKS